MPGTLPPATSPERRMTPAAHLPPASPASPAPPLAPRIGSQRTLHGISITDSYSWMRDHDSPALRDYLAAERGYYDASTRPLARLTGQLYQEARRRTSDAADDCAGWPLGGFVYRTRTPAGEENRQLLRSRPGQGAEQLLLDENVLAASTGFVDVGVREPSPDGTLLAWSADTTGAEIYVLRIRDLAAGRDLPEIIERSYPGSAWSSDSRQLFYLVPDELNRPWQVWRHRIGTDASADVLVLAEHDARFELTLHASRSGGLVVITAASRDTTQVYVIPAGDPAAAPVSIAPRRPGIEYLIDHGAATGDEGGELYIVTNDGATEYRLMRAPLSAPGPQNAPLSVPRPENWSQVSCAAVFPARADTRLVSCDVFAGHLLLTLRRAAAPLLAITDRSGGGISEVPSRLPVGTVRVEHAEAYDAGTVIIVEESLTEPPAWSELDLATGERRELKRRVVPGYDSSLYLTRRLRASSADGTAIPVTLAYRAGTPLDGSAPCLLYGYGAYESCEFPAFDVSLPSVLDRGVVYAIAHVRGGGECGRAWWLQGRLRAKHNTFDDFIAVASWLAGDLPGSRALVDGTAIVSRGMSAGGLLQGAVFSRAPGRWRAVVAEVPFVDCVTTMLDPAIPLTVNEWDEWGDPRDPEDFAYLRSYSPYDNPPAGQRPDLLVTGAVHDPRVLVHEPAKWVARLRETDTAASRLLFRVELGAGAHTGPSGRFSHLAYEAEVQAFILDVIEGAISNPKRPTPPTRLAG